MAMTKTDYDVKNDPDMIELSTKTYVNKSWYQALERHASRAGVPMKTMLSTILQMGLLAWNETSPNEKNRVLASLADMARSMTEGDIIGFGMENESARSGFTFAKKTGKAAADETRLAAGAAAPGAD